MNRDLLRQLWVTASALFGIYGTLLGVGVIGTRVEDAMSGNFATQAALLTPGTTAFSIWTVIYIGLLAYVVWQWLPKQRASERQRAIGWLAGWSMTLNAAWLLVTQRDWIWVSVLVSAVLVAVLAILMVRATRIGANSLLEKIVVDGTFGLYLGWQCVAICANITAAGTANDWSIGPLADQILAVVVLAVAAGIGVALAYKLGARWAVAVAIAWGLGWIAVARLLDEPNSVIIGVGAVVAALAVLAAPPVFRKAQV
ncbi:hypothetical protein [Enemella sp. A6]|uniref:hypothetical protein n=1 Tax=Enemella sp. A6 TaxID=3440152 RepID=UPI003EBE4698